MRECAIDVEISIANMALLDPEHLFQCLNDQDQKVRDAAAWGLTYIDSERLRDHVPELQRLLDHAEEGIAQAAARKLDELGIEPAAGKPAR
jgi:HEAT repeat protein